MQVIGKGKEADTNKLMKTKIYWGASDCFVPTKHMKVGFVGMQENLYTNNFDQGIILLETEKKRLPTKREKVSKVGE